MRVWIVTLILMIVSGCSNEANRAFEEGREAAKAGLSSSDCPYSQSAWSYDDWKRGWIKGKIDMKKESQK
jgi:ribosome modulation factor